MKKTTESFQVSGQIVDLRTKSIYRGTVTVSDGKIASITQDNNQEPYCILPGFIDSHVHIESSMLIPSEFARLAVIHGTVATVSDPHEIANVLGIEGVEYMIENGRQVPFHFYFGAPSCVPATQFETAGAQLGANEIEYLLKQDEIKYLAEMMNYPGVIFDDPEVHAKLNVAKKYGKPIDGHAPGLKGEQAKKYITAGISTDHECFTIDEALEKIKYGMKIQIREGSAAKNFDELIGLMENHADKVLFCSDDKHPDDLVKGHINLLVKRAVAAGYDPISVLHSCIINPIDHYNLKIGLLQQGDNADFIVVDNLKDFNVLKTYINGMKVAENGQSFITSVEASTPNKFEANPIVIEDIQLKYNNKPVRIIEALEGQLITRTIIDTPSTKNGYIINDTERDYLKLVVVNRYQTAKPAVALIKNFGLKRGAIASTVAHDSHNIIAVGADDHAIAKAINSLIASKGGIVAVSQQETKLLPLPVAGLMTTENGYEVAAKYEEINTVVKQNGGTLHAPFMTLSFMALLVIPQLKLSDKGLFDGEQFAFTSLDVS
ncbi:MAG: adenine deaminase [Bacteroidales bacterium]|nr:adenine deaminase [Bacteroidales bacterium]MDD3702195.1 adenine deaminase [Bacteroidales bacterium]MDY0368931.1 adenine deaminase [Bacteroidales bacterium]